MLVGLSLGGWFPVSGEVVVGGALRVGIDLGFGDGIEGGLAGRFADGDTVTFDLSPVWGWAVQLDADDLGRLDTDGQTVEVACDADDTTITVTEGFSTADARPKFFSNQPVMR